MNFVQREETMSSVDFELKRITNENKINRMNNSLKKHLKFMWGSLLVMSSLFVVAAFLHTLPVAFSISMVALIFLVLFVANGIAAWVLYILLDDIGEVR